MSASTAWIGIWKRAAIKSPLSGKATIQLSISNSTYRELHAQVCKFANVLKAQGVKKGDRVCIYLPMISRSGSRHSGLHPYRRGAFHRVRRLFRRCVARPYHRCRLPLSDLCRRKLSRRKNRSFQSSMPIKPPINAPICKQSSSSNIPDMKFLGMKAATFVTTKPWSKHPPIARR